MNKINIAASRRPATAIVVCLALQLCLSVLGYNLPARAGGPTFMSVRGDRLILDDKPVLLKGVNFYPLHRSFAEMWWSWDSGLVREGLRQAADLGSNTVRVLIPYGELYGWTRPDGSVDPEYLDMLRQFLQIAAEFNIRSIVTLFDFEELAAPGTREELAHRRYAQQIVTAFRDDDRILAWDLHNEPDNYGRWKTEDDPEAALTWLYRMREYVRSLDVNHLITIGVGKRQNYFRQNSQGYRVLDLVDFIAYHSYNADALAEELYELQEVTRRQKPVILEEMGWPSGPIFSTFFSENIQAEKYRKTLATAQSHNLSGVLQWSLYDADAVGAPPWDDLNNYYGVIKRNGQFKPATAIWRDNWKGGPLPAASTVTSLPLTTRPDRRTLHYFPQSDHYIGTPLYELWRRAGEVEVFGFPVTDTFLTEDIGEGRHNFVNDENKTPLVQYFEKGRFEYHRERRNLPEYEPLKDTPLDKYFFLIDRGNVGIELAAARGYQFSPATRLNQANNATYRWFTQTQHSLQEPFLSYWQRQRGNLVFGSPISEPFEETNPETGQRRLVQYFEKTRLEYRPEFAPTRSAVVVGNAGSELLKLKGWLDRAYPEHQPVSSGTVSGQASAAPDQVQSRTGFADPAFEKVWKRTDSPVANGTARRTWLWGPGPLKTVLEPYLEAPGGTRLVQYFDKTRMELTNPGGDRADKWYVTNGLLVREMITGQKQIGNNTFVPLTPAAVPLAGDPPGSNPNAPSYASLQQWAAPENKQTDRTGQPVDRVLQKDGSLAPVAPRLADGARLSHFVPETGHNIAGVFWDFLTGTRGPLMDVDANRLITGDVVDWLFSTGLPLTEPYWTRARVAGADKDVLVQAFERRVLTFTPDNPPGFRVEMGNVGQHYYAWRNSEPEPREARPVSSGGGQGPDAAIRSELNQSGGLAFRAVSPAGFYKYTSRAGEAAGAATLLGSPAGALAPLPGPGLVYISPDQAGRLAIYGHDLRGSGRVLAYGIGGALSPDGSRLAYLHFTDAENISLSLLDLASGQSHPVATGVLPFAAWSADGGKLVFYRKEVNRLTVMISENGGTPRELWTSPPDSLGDTPVFSPDGRWLAFTLLRMIPDERGPKIGTAEVHLLDLSGGQEKLVASGAARPVWSPDGTKLAYAGWNEPALWQAKWENDTAARPQRMAAGQGCQAECANIGRPAYSANGNWLAFTGPGGDLQVVRSTGGPAYTLGTNGYDPVWTK